MKKIPPAIFAIFLITMVVSCQHPSIYDCTGISPTYTNNVKPILDSYCPMPGMGCHSSGRGAGGFDLGSYAGALVAGSNRKFMGTIEHLKGYTAMPKGGVMIPDAKIQILYCWIQNGSPE